MHLVYLNEFETGENVDLTSEESRHLVKVLRAKSGDLVYLTDGKGRLAKGRLYFDTNKSATVEIVSIDKKEATFPSLTVAISPIKSPARWEWFLEKATELGVSRIQPIICERTEKHRIKKERNEKILIAAMKQSNRLYLPIFNEPKSLIDFIGEEYKGQAFIAHCNDGKKVNLYRHIKSSNNCTFLIGPEGDFTEKEVENSLAGGFQAVSLGNYRLRTETAAIVVCQSFNFVNTL